jgi:hypothetical protein
MLTGAYYDHDVMSGGQEGRVVVTECCTLWCRCVASAQLSASYIQDAYSTKYRAGDTAKTLSCLPCTRAFNVGGVFMGYS